ncbi:hypothetical protein [Musicola paradisiaca]|uniref:Nucleotidyltransferase domain-containing protein n=1 Tax=Musicola paradisiaca (strain Ech703) TaxID=579405 RepID=C6CBI8_MUSP7|nr:hypothetical protein [Musicola paradisiaca]ACS84773.1 conserved hypothetical protein [Musicola paradisiaca Ech703]
MSILTKETQNELAALIEKALIADSNLITSYLSGSITEGFATSKSDFDVYAIVSSENKQCNTEIFIPFNDKICELTVVSIDKINEIISNLNSQEIISWYESHLLHRLLTGISIHHESALFSLKNSIPKDELCKFLLNKAKKFGEKCFSDCMGNMIDNDYITAAFNAERTLHASIDCMLAFHNSTSTLIKWRVKNAIKKFGKDNEYFKSYLLVCSKINVINDTSALEYIQAVGRVWQATLDYIQGKECCDVEIELRQERLLGHLKIKDNNSIIKKPLYRVIFERSKLVLIESSAICEITADAYKVWLSIDNSKDIDKVISDLSENDIDSNTTKFYIDEFSKIGAILR